MRALVVLLFLVVCGVGFPASVSAQVPSANAPAKAAAAAKPAAAKPAAAKPSASAAASAAPEASAALPEPAPSAQVDPGFPPEDFKLGPQTVQLGHEIEIDVPEGYGMLIGATMRKVLKENGHFDTSGDIGILQSMDEGSQVVFFLAYEDAGYVKDDETIDAPELLKALQEGQTEANVERKKRGFPGLEVRAWAKEPSYDKSQRHFVWGLDVYSEGDPAPSINHFTRVLGRRGVLSINLVTDKSNWTAALPEGERILKTVRFRPGSTYADFDEKTDKVAEYGLSGLVLGGLGLGAAKAVKAGLFAKFFAVIAKGGKAIYLLLIGVVAAAARLFKGKGSSSSDES